MPLQGNATVCMDASNAMWKISIANRVHSHRVAYFKCVRHNTGFPHWPFHDEEMLNTVDVYLLPNPGILTALDAQDCGQGLFFTNAYPGYPQRIWITIIMAYCRIYISWVVFSWYEGLVTMPTSFQKILVHRYLSITRMPRGWERGSVACWS